ncbi:MAG: hypothetical protein VX589_09510 [Myxococcota bacterium]|nr:hypothetical protein [Myxococcota bacterium]
MSNFRLRGYTRRILAHMVDVVGPTWPDAQFDLKDDILDDLEGLVRGYPPFVRFGICFMLWFVEFGGPITLTGVMPLSFLSRKKSARRLQVLLSHRFPPFRNMAKFLKIVISIAAYGRPEVEAFLGAPRRRWRQTRHAFRDDLLHINEAHQRPPVPQAIGAGERATPATYLNFEGDQTRMAKPSDAAPDIEVQHAHH